MQMYIYIYIYIYNVYIYVGQAGQPGVERGAGAESFCSSTANLCAEIYPY